MSLFTITDKSKLLLKLVISGDSVPFMYKNKDKKNCFIDKKQRPSMFGNLYFTIQIRALVNNGLLCLDKETSEVSVNCFVGGVLIERKIKGCHAVPTPKALIEIGGYL